MNGHDLGNALIGQILALAFIAFGSGILLASIVAVLAWWLS